MTAEFASLLLALAICLFAAISLAIAFWALMTSPKR